MRTEVARVDPDQPAPDVIARAVAVLRGGGLVAFPTETVYGLGADALSAAACARIFTAKGRPPHNPIIVHAAGLVEARQVVSAWPESATGLAERFWPGPLTLVLPKHPAVPDVVTAGGSTVAVRVPAHPVALALLKAAAIPVAAPSANLSGQLSPTRAEHVLRALDGRIDLVIDAGPTPGGLESTVLDLSQTPPRLLRPGLIAPSQIEAVIGPIDASQPAIASSARSLPAPGMLPRHYAPRAPLECFEGTAAALVGAMSRQGMKVGWLKFGDEDGPEWIGVISIRLPQDPAAYAARLYAALHDLDNAGVERIIVELPPDTEPWLTVRDRLLRASMR